MKAVELDGITTRFGADAIFSNLSLSVAPQEFVCLLGPSGCGKSTILRLVGGLLGPSAGAVRVGGRTPEEAWRSIAYVFQSPRLVPWRNARDNVALGIELRDPAVAKAQRRERAAALLAMVGLGNDMQKFPAMLSGGERQRVAIARAVVNRPKILLAD